MDCITLNSGYKIDCRVAGGAKVGWLANHVTDNYYVKDTGDASGTYSAVADGGSGLILITADNGSGGHGLKPGLVIALSAGSYNGNYTVQTTPTTTTFTVKATFGSTDSGNFAFAPQTNKIIGTSDANGTPLTFVKIEQEIETIQVTCTGTGSVENGNFFEEQTISMTLFSSKSQASEDARRTLMGQLTKGRFVAVIQDNNKVKRVYGAVNGLQLSEGSNSSGKALGDLAGFTFTLKASEPELAYVYDDAGDSSGTPAEAYTAFTLPS